MLCFIKVLTEILKNIFFETLKGRGGGPFSWVKHPSATDPTVWMYYFGLFILCSESHRGRIVLVWNGKQRAHGCSAFL